MTVQVIDSNNALAHWLALLDAASMGDDIVIERNGAPIAAIRNQLLEEGTLSE
jgi:hypothetical protein